MIERIIKFIRISIGDLIVGAYIIMFGYYFTLVRQNPIPTEGWVGTVFIVVMWLLTRNDKNFELTIGKMNLKVTDKDIVKIIADRRRATDSKEELKNVVEKEQK